MLSGWDSGRHVFVACGCPKQVTCCAPVAAPRASCVHAAVSRRRPASAAACCRLLGMHPLWSLQFPWTLCEELGMATQGTLQTIGTVRASSLG